MSEKTPISSNHYPAKYKDRFDGRQSFIGKMIHIIRKNPIMFRRLLSLCMTLPFFGCASKAEPQKTTESDQGRRVEIRIGGGEDFAAKRLPFKIVTISRDQKPTDNEPFHTSGGNWTFLDCIAENQQKFVVGVVTKTTDEGRPSSWGHAILAVSDNESGGQFVEQFAEAFGGTVPPSSKSPQLPKPLFINTAILAEDFHQDSDGSFVEGGGGWTATKWFPSNDLAEAEVYFNFNLNQQIGEFSEKDTDYADSLLSIFAAALRDGPRPPRTPENDPNLSIEGPAIGPSRNLLKRRTSLTTFTSDSRHAVFQDGGKTLSLQLDGLDSEPIEIALFEHSPWQVHLVNDGMDLLVQEGVPDEPGVKSSADPMRFWWINQSTKEKTLLRGPEKEFRLTEKPFSPDYRYVVLDQWVDDSQRKTRNKVLHLLDRTNGTAIKVQLPNDDLSVVGWRETPGGLRAVAVTNRWGFDKAKPSKSLLIDPASGKLERQDQTTVDATEDLLSPDGKHRVRIDDGELAVTNLITSEVHRFSFHEEDQPFVGKACVEWVNPDYLKFNAPKLAFIDVRTMKMNFPASADGNQFHTGAYTFSPDFRWVLVQSDGIDGEGLFIAPIQLPQD